LAWLELLKIDACVFLDLHLYQAFGEVFQIIDREAAGSFGTWLCLSPDIRIAGPCTELL
jgi:hypothetical protein